jgi:hypothetical protein
MPCVEIIANGTFWNVTSESIAGEEMAIEYLILLEYNSVIMIHLDFDVLVVEFTKYKRTRTSLKIQYNIQHKITIFRL